MEQDLERSEEKVELSERFVCLIFCFIELKIAWKIMTFSRSFVQCSLILTTFFMIQLIHGKHVVCNNLANPNKLHHFPTIYLFKPKPLE